jgi:hypothetical protein
MRLSGFVFIIIGVAVAIASWVLLRGGQKMALFLYTGIAMAVFGAIRVYVERDIPKQEESRKQLASQLPSPRHNSDIPRTCSVCRSRNHPKATFCGYCGNRL